MKLGTVALWMALMAEAVILPTVFGVSGFC